MQKKVSIIMPTYQGYNLIAKSIKSILGQTYTNIELIVVDDNGEGTEAQLKTQQVIDTFSHDKRLIYIAHKKNKNGSAARNTGIRAATGSYLAFLDDDDCFFEDKIAKQIAKMESLPATYGMVYGGLEEFYSENNKKIILPHEVDDFLFSYLAGSLYVCSSTIFLKTEVINRVGFWDESFRRHQDMEFISRVAAEYDVSFIDEPCIKKVRLDRNLPSDGKKCEILRLHYLNKMKPLITKYGKKEQREIYFFHYLSIGKNYIKNRDFIPAIKYALKSKKTISMLRYYVKDAMKYFLK